METLKYKRVLLKVSGEALAGQQAGRRGVDFDMLESVAAAVRQCVDLGVQIGVVVGGGNFWRGLKDGKEMERTRADHMGMLATTINALALADVLEKAGVTVRVQTAIDMSKIAEPYVRLRAIRHLEKGRVVIFACGTGNPYCSTDTGAALRACEINADILLLAKNVDGIYDDDPKKNPAAKKIDKITHMEVINRGLKAMDTTAITMCMDNDVPVLAFALSEKDAIVRAIAGEQTGTLITNEI